MRFQVPDQWYTWDALRALGNHRLVQLTVLIPIVGYLVLFNEHLSQYWTLSRELVDAQSLFELLWDAGHQPAGVVSYRLYCLYFGLCLIAAASAMFAWFCPRYVKSYGSAAEFVATEQPIMLPERLAKMKSEVIEARLRSQFPIHKFSLSDVVRYDDSDDHGGVVLPGEPGSEEHQDAIRAIRRMKQFVSEYRQEDVGTIMTRWFVPQKYHRPRMRFAVWLLYGAGFLVLAVPTIDVFLLVVVSLVT